MHRSPDLADVDALPAASLTYSVIPANAIMSVAYLNMYLPYASQGTTSNVDVRAVKSAWTTSATWNKRDATNNWAAAGGDRTPTVYERYPFTASGAYQSAQVTKLVQNDLDGQVGDFGFILQKTSQDTTAITHFASPSSANPPNLYVEWDPRTGVRKGNTAIINEKLSDRTGVSINPATGNAAVSTKELTIAGTGVDLNVAHTSQSLRIRLPSSHGHVQLRERAERIHRGHPRRNGTQRRRLLRLRRQRRRNQRNLRDRPHHQLQRPRPSHQLHPLRTIRDRTDLLRQRQPEPGHLRDDHLHAISSVPGPGLDRDRLHHHLDRPRPRRAPPGHPHRGHQHSRIRYGVCAVHRQPGQRPRHDHPQRHHPRSELLLLRVRVGTP